MKSLKTKFILLITVLIVLVVIGTSGVLVNQEKQKLEQDIYFNSRSFAELSLQPIISITEEYLLKGNTIFFERDLGSLLKRTSDVDGIAIYRFSGEKVYQSQQSTAEITQIKSAFISIKTFDNQVYFLEKNPSGDYDLSDANGRKLSLIEEQKITRKLQNIVIPFEGKYAVEYNVTYDSLLKRLIASAYQIILIGIVSIICSILFGYFLATIVVSPLRKLTSAVKDIAQGNFTKRVNISSHDEVGDLADSVNTMALDLEKSTEAKIYKERVKKELEIAAKIQKDLLPKSLPQIQDLDIAGEVIPATEIGGDVYDILFDADKESYFYVGDVTGHGIPAGLLSSVTNAIVTSTIEFRDLTKIVANLNRVLKMKTAGNLFLTLVLVKHIASGEFEYVSAGHEQILMYKATTNEVIYLESGGIALGLFPDIQSKLELRKISLQPNDFIMLYTDGIPEAWKSETESLGFEGFANIVKKYASLNDASKIKESVLADIKAYMNGYEQKDDITLMVIRRT